jgi:CBS domain-containing protein
MTKETKMKVEDVMTKRVATCRMETNLAEAAAIMWDNNCGALPVLNDASEVVGILTDRDMFIALGTRNARPSELLTCDVIEKSVLICKSSADLLAALQMMTAGQIRRLPVVEDNDHLAGIISLDDVVLCSASEGKNQLPVPPLDLIAAMRTIYSGRNQRPSMAAAA